jgi:hypothetical protein
LETIYGFVLVVRGRDLESCLRHLRNSIRYSEETGFSPYLGLAWTCTGWAHWLQGNLQMARECGQKAASIHGGGGVSVMSSLAQLLLGAISLDSGDMSSARTSLGEALRMSRVNGERYIEGRAMLWVGRVHGKADTCELAAAEEHIIGGISLLEKMNLRPWQAEGHMFAGELYTDSGQLGRAMTSLKKAQSMFQDMGMDHWSGRAEVSLGRLESLLA